MTDRWVIARARAGVVGESGRVCHLFAVELQSAGNNDRAALCGATFAVGELELLDAPGGMPCERCLAAASEAPVVADSVAQRLSAIEHRLDELVRQVEALARLVGRLGGV